MSCRCSRVVSAVAVVVSLVGVVGCESVSPSSARTITAAPYRLAPPKPLQRTALPRANRPVALGEADGAVRDGATVFGEEPAVTNLDPALLGALRRAAKDAARHAVVFYVDSGWRSARYQEQLLQQAISKYGSRAKAARWVATPATSAHVSGDAVDIGHDDARSWLSKHGAKYGLCQTYRNEPWHYELRPRAVNHGCPAKYADPAHDPRMQQ
jgi:D-alanyl-D-alanine carboxypeptidase